ncbi:MAG: hypothetical protein JST80_08980 [Bdellovibrionales bacterium]|nr:hypothetical protein [Bdellovibrionales bacterium]
MKKFFVWMLLLTVALPARAESSGSVSQGVDVGINFPHIYGITYERLHKSAGWSWGVGLGVIPTINFTSGSSQVGISSFNFDVRGRWHPFSGGFFLGAALGFQNVKGSGAQTIDVSGQPVPTLVAVGINNLYLTPHVGWLWEIGPVLFGLEFGEQLGFGGTSTLDLSITDPSMQSYLAQVQATQQYQTFKREVEDGFSKLGNLQIFYAAVRLGFAF